MQRDACYCPQRVLHLSDCLSFCLTLPRDFTPSLSLSLSLSLTLARSLVLSPSIPTFFSRPLSLYLCLSFTHSFCLVHARCLPSSPSLTLTRARALALSSLPLSRSLCLCVCLFLAVSLYSFFLSANLSRAIAHSVSFSLPLERLPVPYKGRERVLEKSDSLVRENTQTLRIVLGTRGTQVRGIGKAHDRSNCFAKQFISPSRKHVKTKDEPHNKH